MGSFPSDFRLLVFRPFVDEVLVGKIKCCTREGVYLSLGFFDDILIPPEALQHPHRFDESDQVCSPKPLAGQGIFSCANCKFVYLESSGVGLGVPCRG